MLLFYCILFFMNYESTDIQFISLEYKVFAALLQLLISLKAGLLFNGKNVNLIILSIMMCYWRSYGMNELSGTRYGKLQCMFGKLQCMAFILFTLARSCWKSNQTFTNIRFLGNIFRKYYRQGGLISNVSLPF